MRDRKKFSVEEMSQLMRDFDAIVEPWCESNELSLHRAFELSREHDPEKYQILSDLWATVCGREYLRSLFRSRGGILRESNRPPKPAWETDNAGDTPGKTH